MEADNIFCRNPDNTAYYALEPPFTLKKIRSGIHITAPHLKSL